MYRIAQDDTDITAFNIPAAAMSKVFNLALAKKDWISKDDTSAIFYDLTLLNNRMESLKKLFPSDTLHAVAIKANPLTKILKKIQAADLGLEAASLPELYLAQAAGFDTSKLVFDSPAKTTEEIAYALEAGIHINADSFDELDRIAVLLNDIHSESHIGLRINPQVGTGTILTTSVAGTISKFGVPINEHAEKIKKYFLLYPWLRAVHLHIGSQGCPVPLMVNGIRKVLDFTLECNQLLKEAGKKQLIDIFDIGGGLPVSYYPDQPIISIQEYTSLLKTSCAELFNGDFKLITEFGRYIHANAGWIASKVEYVRNEDNYAIITIHTGADLLLRESYHPQDWHHEISVVDQEGRMKTGVPKKKYIIAGPLCFAGDILAKDIELPEVNVGDYLLIHDAGAYTLSMWSRYNSRQIPKVIGYHQEGRDFEIIKEREQKEALFSFWS